MEYSKFYEIWDRKKVLDVKTIGISEMENYENIFEMNENIF